MLFLLLRRVKDPHEFFTGDCFLFIQHLRQLIQQRAVLRQQAVRPLMLRADQLDDLPVDLTLRLLRAAHGRIAAQILIPRGLHGDHVEFIRHAVLRDHGARDARGLLDVVRSAGRDLTERDLLGSAAAGQGGDLDVKRGYILLFFQLVFFLDSLLDFRDAINHVLSFVDQRNAFYPVTRVDACGSGRG